MHKDVDRWSLALSSHQAWRHVQKLTIVLQLPRGEGTTAQSKDRGSDLNDGESSESMLLRSQHYGAMVEAAPLTPEEREKHEEACQPLSEFIEKVPGLQDLIWDCPVQVPRSVLRSLEQHPRIRINVRYFCLRSLIRLRNQPHQVDDDELALATLP